MKKQSIWCEITRINYKEIFPQKLITDECPICKKHGISCLIQAHKESIKYFYAYSLENEEIIMNAMESQ
jgi:hypothetical protein